MSIFGKFGKKSSSNTTQQEGSSSRGSRQSEQTSSPSNRPKSPIRPSSRNRGKTIKKDFGELLNDISLDIHNRINILKENNITPHNKANFEQNMQETYRNTAKNLGGLFKNLSEKNTGGSKYKSLNKLLDVTPFITNNPDTQMTELKRRILGLFLGDRLGNEEGHLEAPSAKIYLSDNNQQKALMKKDDIIELSKILNQLPSDAVEVFQKEVGIHPKEFDTLKNTLKNIEKEVVPFLSGEAKLKILKTSLSEMQNFHTLNNPRQGRVFDKGGLSHQYNKIENIYNTGMIEHIENIFSHFIIENSTGIEKELLNFLTEGNTSTRRYRGAIKPIEHFVNEMDKRETATSQSDIEIMCNFFQDPHFQNSFQTKLNINDAQFNKIKNTLSDILRTKHHKDEKLELQEHLKQASDVAKSIETLYTEEYRGEFQGNDTHLRKELQDKLDIINVERAKRKKEPILQNRTADKHKDFVNKTLNEILAERDSQFLNHYDKIFHATPHINPLESETQIVSLLLGKNIPEDKNPIQYFLEHHARSKVFNLNGIRHLSMILNHERIQNELPTDPYTIRKNELITKTLNKIVTHYRDTIEHIKPFGEFIDTSIKQITKESRFSRYNTDYIFKDEHEIERRLLGVIHSAGIKDEGYRYILNKTPYDNIQDIYQKAKEFPSEKKEKIKKIHDILQNLHGVNLTIFKNTYHCDDKKFETIKNIFSKVVRLDDAGSSRANPRLSSASSSKSTATHPRRPENLSSYSVSSSLPQKNIASSEINASVASSSATRTNPRHSTVASSSGSTTNDTKVPESFDLLGLDTPPAPKDDADLYPSQGDFNPYPPASSSAVSLPKDLMSSGELKEMATLMGVTDLDKLLSPSNTTPQLTTGESSKQSNIIFSPADIEILTLVKSKNPFAEEEMPQSINSFLPDNIGDLLTGSTNLSPIDETSYHPDYDLAILEIPKDDANLDMIKDTYNMFRTELTTIAVQLLNNKVVETRAEALRHPEYIEAKKNFKPKEDAYKRLKKHFKES